MNRHMKDPGSAITHFIGMIMAIFAAIPLLLRAAKEPQTVYLVSLSVFAVSMILLSIVWGIALIGIFIASCWVFCPKWFSSLLYIGMGWTCVLAFGKIIGGLSHAQFAWLLAGGIIYTIGGLIYALKLPIFNNKHKNFGSHEIFHLFVMGGSFCHFILMFSHL